jgi:uncharacterized membrane protein
MQPLTENFISSCRIEHGYRLRGENMTRIEVFVDAAFAFAVTMLVISIDEIPANVPELIEASKQIPAFVVSVSLLMWIWQTHSIWSKRFGLEDVQTILISVLLIILVLVFIYPLKIMAMGMFAWVTQGFLPSDFDINTWGELRFLFIYFAGVFTLFFLLFVWMTRHTLALHESLKLSTSEIYNLTTELYIRYSLIGVGVLGLLISLVLPDRFIPFAGFVYAGIGLVFWIIETKRPLAK